MYIKTGKKELITVLLVGLCLNLSALHSHSLFSLTDSDAGDIPHHIKKETPVCFACQHLTLGIPSFPESLVIPIPFDQAGLFISIEAETDYTPSSVSNKSPPLSLLRKG